MEKIMSTTENKLRDFLIELGCNEKLRKKYEKHPDKVMEKHGLTDKEQQWVMHGNTEEINKHIGENYFSTTFVHVSRK